LHPVPPGDIDEDGLTYPGDPSAMPRGSRGGPYGDPYSGSERMPPRGSPDQPTAGTYPPRGSYDSRWGYDPRGGYDPRYDHGGYDPRGPGAYDPPPASEDSARMRPPGAVTPNGSGQVIAALPPEDQPEVGERKEMSPRLRRQMVDYPTKEAPGTIVIDTPNTYLYLVLGHAKALRYGIGVGREGFTWSGTERVSRMSEWPDWYPPQEMIARQPYLPRMMAGGSGNPLGARALYLGNTLYRIHGTNQPSTIGQTVSSGCIRLTNEDIEDLYSRVTVGTRVVVLQGRPSTPAAAAAR
jgi:lipoprotein-anchoring transpeptidase ErfK/SrfK